MRLVSSNTFLIPVLYAFTFVLILGFVGLYQDVFADTNDPPSGEKTPIPAWIKSNAEWWAKGIISDKDFVSGIAFLVKEGIIQVDNVEFDPQGNISVDDNVQVPKWIRTNAEWWVQGIISDDDFVSGIQFMVKEKIIDFKERKEITSTQTGIMIGGIFIELPDEERYKAVNAGSTIVVAEEKMLEWVLEADNYALKQLDDRVDDAWHTLDETGDKNDMNYALALESYIDDSKSLTKTTLDALKDATERKENFLQNAQESGFDKFRLETDATSKLGSNAEVSSVKSDKDYKDAKDAAEEVEKIIEKAVKDLKNTLKQCDNKIDSSPEWKPTTTGESIFKGPDGVIYWVDKSGDMWFQGPFDVMKNKFAPPPPLPSKSPSVCDVVGLDSFSDYYLVDIDVAPDVDKTVEIPVPGTDIGSSYGFYPQKTYISFTHNIGESPCPQHIIYIDLPTWSGTWTVASKPSWADVDIDIGGHFARIQFNCQLDAYVTQKLSGTVTIHATYRPEVDLDDEDYVVTIEGQINASSSSTSSETSTQTEEEEETVTEEPEMPEEKRWIPVYLIAGSYFPQIQFSWTAPHEGACDDWHTHTTQAYNADAQLISLTDPNPSGCGLGTVTIMSSHSLEMTQSQIDKWEAAAGTDINPGQ